MHTLAWVDDHHLEGTLSIKVAPGLAKEARAKLLDAALVEALDAAATAQSLIRTASPSRFAQELPGRDEEGRTRFLLRGRAEGDYLVPA